MADEGEHICIVKEVLYKEAPHNGNNWYYDSTGSLVITVGDGATLTGHQLKGRNNISVL